MPKNPVEGDSRSVCLADSTEHMATALSLAELALGNTSPNPAVGAVIVKEGVVIGQGYTQPPGSAHAEIVALQQAGAAAKGAKMYVTLEPCCHHGKTGPCTQAIINAGISEVHAAIIDPNPLISGKGIEELAQAGIKTFVGELEERATQINEWYIKFITTGLPFVIAKFAMSLDGKIATSTGDSKWISSAESRKRAHSLRCVVDAIAAGANTVIADNPRLSARRCEGKGDKTERQPLRVIIDGKGRIPSSAQLFKERGNTLVVVAESVEQDKVAELRRVGAEVMELPAEHDIIDLATMLNILGERQITSILVEGGGGLLGSLFDGGLVDKVWAFIAPIIVGGEHARTPVGGRGAATIAESLNLQRVHVELLGDNVLLTGYLRGSDYVYRDN